MSLYNGIDPVAVAMLGVFTETYTTTGENTANLYASWGLLEDAPQVVFAYSGPTMLYYYRQLVENG